MEILAPGHWQRTIERIALEFGIESANLIQTICDRFSDKPLTGLPLRPKETVGVVTRVPESSRELSVDLTMGIVAARNAMKGVVYPGDLEQWIGAGHLNVASGISGILQTLLHEQVALDEDVAWLRTAVEANRHDLPPGLFNGASGIAAVLFQAGCEDLADTVFQSVAHRYTSFRRSDLFGGLAGIGLGLLSYGIASGNDQYLQCACEVGRKLVYRVIRMHDDWARRSLERRSGLFYGFSGVSLLLSTLARITSDLSYADASEECIRLDLSHCKEYGGGVLGVLDEDANRTLPYLAWGSAGILIALAQLRAISGYKDAFISEYAGLIAACSSNFYAFPSLFNGRAGIVAALAASSLGDPAVLEIARKQARSLTEALLVWNNHTFIPGEQYLRLSTDLGTGNAGVVSALSSLDTGVPLWIPLTAAEETLATFAKSTQGVLQDTTYINPRKGGE